MLAFKPGALGHQTLFKLSGDVAGHTFNAEFVGLDKNWGKCVLCVCVCVFFVRVCVFVFVCVSVCLCFDELLIEIPQDIPLSPYL